MEPRVSKIETPTASSCTYNSKLFNTAYHKSLYINDVNMFSPNAAMSPISPSFTNTKTSDVNDITLFDIDSNIVNTYKDNKTSYNINDNECSLSLGTDFNKRINDTKHAYDLYTISPSLSRRVTITPKKSNVYHVYKSSNEMSLSLGGINAALFMSPKLKTSGVKFSFIEPVYETKSLSNDIDTDNDNNTIKTINTNNTNNNIDVISLNDSNILDDELKDPNDGAITDIEIDIEYEINKTIQQEFKVKTPTPKKKNKHVRHSKTMELNINAKRKSVGKRRRSFIENKKKSSEIIRILTPVKTEETNINTDETSTETDTYRSSMTEDNNDTDDDILQRSQTISLIKKNKLPNNNTKLPMQSKSDHNYGNIYYIRNPRKKIMDSCYV